MQPLTIDTHKALLDVAGRPIIEWIVDALIARDVRDVVVVTGYRADDVRAHLRRAYPALRATFVHNPRYPETNNIYSLALALEGGLCDDGIILIECDVIFEPAVLDRLLAAPEPDVALVDRYRPGMDGTVVRIAHGAISAIVPPHVQDASFDFTGTYKTLNIYRFSPEFCSGPFKKLLTYYATVIDDNQYYEMILGILIYVQRATIHAEVLTGERWAEIDDPNDLATARFVFDPASRRDLLDSSFGGYWRYDVLDFRYLRNMYFPPNAMLAEIRTALPALMGNYGSSQSILNRKLAYFLGCDERRVLALNGASQAFPLLHAYFGAARVAIPDPTFGEFSRAFPDATLYPADGYPDLAAWDRLARCHDLVVVVNPNNPTGLCRPTDQVYRLVAANPATTFVLDESFIEFSDQESIIPALEERPLPNLIVLKSLSKTLGVPGVRLGCLYMGHLAFDAFVRRQLPVWNLNSVAEHVLELVLKHRTALAASYTRTMADRAQFAALLDALPAVRRVSAGGANFVLVELACTPAQGRCVVDRLLADYGMYVADVSGRFGGTVCRLRLAVRLPRENAWLVECLQRAAAAPAGGDAAMPLAVGDDV